MVKNLPTGKLEEQKIYLPGWDTKRCIVPTRYTIGFLIVDGVVVGGFPGDLTKQGLDGSYQNNVNLCYNTFVRFSLLRGPGFPGASCVKREAPRRQGASSHKGEFPTMK